MPGSFRNWESPFSHLNLLVWPGGDPPSIGTGIVRPDGLDVNQDRLLGQISDAEQEAPTAADEAQLPLSHEPSEVILVVAGDLCGNVQRDPLIVLSRRDRLELGEHLVT